MPAPDIALTVPKRFRFGLKRFRFCDGETIRQEGGAGLTALTLDRIASGRRSHPALNRSKHSTNEHSSQGHGGFPDEPAAFESNATVDIQHRVNESAPNASMSTQDRYDVIMDPTDTWTVWDLINDEPAMFGDHLLASLTRVEAVAARDVMNDAWRRLQESALTNRTDAA